ncbi:uncharacterized protein [Watersipora subatra]|uniref:uncharacterized protein n=1 Tax=Watersipora subatra TaxID=2589382 RepID=UPI00355C12D2
MTSRTNSLQLGGILIIFTATILKASFLRLQSDPSQCNLEVWANMSSLSTPSSFIPRSAGESEGYLVGTSGELALVTKSDVGNNNLNVRDAGVDVGGIALDENDNVLFTETSEYCIKKILEATGTIEWAGSCGTYGDVLGTMSDARFGQLYNIAANAERNKFYVVDRREVIKVIEPEDDNVEEKVTGIAQLYALVVASNGDLFFAGQQALYKIYENSDIAEIVAGAPNQPGHDDGTLAVARFEYLMGLVILEDYEWIVAADSANSLRIIDLEDETVSTTAIGSEDITDCTLNDCKLKKPLDMRLDNGWLVIVDDYMIKRITCSGSLLATTTPITTQAPTTSTTQAPTTSMTQAPTTTSTAHVTTATSPNDLQANATTVSFIYKYSVIRERTATAMVVAKTGPDQFICSGTMLESFNTYQVKNCLFFCVKVPSCECLTYTQGSCDTKKNAPITAGPTARAKTKPKPKTQ